MLVQSHTGELHLLPALPAAWPGGRVSGIRARGGLEVDLSWADGVLVDATLTGATTGPVVIRYGDRRVEVASAAGGTRVRLADFH
jgi:alpha-L-fucosidase 2